MSNNKALPHESFEDSPTPTPPDPLTQEEWTSSATIAQRPASDVRMRFNESQGKMKDTMQSNMRCDGNQLGMTSCKKLYVLIASCVTVRCSIIGEGRGGFRNSARLQRSRRVVLRIKTK